MKKIAIASGLITLGLIGLSSPALADANDISANMTIDHSTFESGELNSQSVAITFPLSTAVAGDRLYIDLPVGYAFAASDGVSGVQNYDPTTGICGTFDTGVTIPNLPGLASYTCLSTPEYPFEFLISGDVPNRDYVINLAPHSFRAKTTTVDEPGDITITLAISGDPQVTDDFGSVDVTTLGSKLPNTGVDVFATAAAGTLAGLAGLVAVAAVALRRRARS